MRGYCTPQGCCGQPGQFRGSVHEDPAKQVDLVLQPKYNADIN